MPVLDLSAVLSEKLAYVGLLSVMLVPKNTSLRRRLKEALLAGFVLDVGAVTGNAFFTAQEIAEDAPKTRLAEVLPEALKSLERRNVHKGINAGMIFGEALKIGGTVEDAKERMRTAAGSMPGFAKNSLARDWDEYRCASHLWFTHAMLPGWTDLWALPSHEMVIEILSHADALRRKGERHRTGSRGVFLLTPEETWKFRLPDGAMLRPIDFG
jgi:hypothetical protein